MVLVDDDDVAKLLTNLPPFSQSSVVNVFVLGIVIALTAILLMLTVFTAAYHYPLSKVNCVLQITSVTILLTNVCASAGTKLSFLHNIGSQWPHAFPYIGQEVPPSKPQWSTVERVFFVMLQSFTTISAHVRLC